jgi:hypothetical protein
MQQQTPMRRLQHTLNEIKLIVSENFDLLELVKKKPQVNYILGIDSPGVKDDYLLIFKSLQSKRSFSFTFNYQDKNNNILPVSKWKCIATIKDKEFSPKNRTKNNFIEEQNDRKKQRNIANRTKISSTKLSFSEFRDLLKNLKIELSLNSGNEDKIFEKVHLIFNIDDLSKAKGIKKTKIKSFIEKKQKEYKIFEVEENLLKQEKKLDKDIKEFKNEYESLDSYIELKEMENKIKELRETLGDKRKELLSKYDIPNTRRKIIRKKEKLDTSDANLKKDIAESLPDSSKSIKTSINIYIDDTSQKRRNKNTM